MDASKKILVTGGIKSGKSRYALQRAAETAGEKVFLATAQALDDDMQRKIESHQRERGSSFVTVEEPVYLAGTLSALKKRPALIIIDCLTLWINNLIHTFEDPDKIRRQEDLFLEQLRSVETPMIIVTNEVGLGIVGDNQLSRKFVNEIGSLNQEVAKLCDEVIMVVSGLPQKIKGHNLYAKVD